MEESETKTGEEEFRKSFTDFTEASYVDALELAKRNYIFARFTHPPAGKHVLWRHDIDFSAHRALKLAMLEYQAGVVATYFLYPHSPFYNLFSPDIRDIVRRIASLGHDLGLHFDPTFSGAVKREQILKNIAIEKRWIHELTGVVPVALSYHLFGVLAVPPPDDAVVCKMVNAYGKGIWGSYGYCSDSNGIWRFRRLYDVLSEATEDKLQVLTHPEVWTPEPMSPRARIQRCIDGYAVAAGKYYDDLVSASGRPNVR